MTDHAPQSITCTCLDFQKHQWCHHMPQGALKTGWTPQQDNVNSKIANVMSNVNQQESWRTRLRTNLAHILELYPNELGEIEEVISSERTRLLDEVRSLVTAGELENFTSDGLANYLYKALDTLGEK